MVYFINRGGGMANEGPMSEENVREQIASGRLGMNALIWAQGMPEWITVGVWMNQGAPHVPQLPPLIGQAQAYRPVAAGYGLPVPADKKGTACVTMAQVGLVFGVLSTVVSFAFLAYLDALHSGMINYDDAAIGGVSPYSDGALLLLGVSLLALLISYITFIIGWLWSLVRVWRVLQMIKPHIGEELPTPGWAAGGLFIPFFNFYWIFVSYGAIPKFARRLPGNPPRINETNIMLMNVGFLGGMIFPPLALMQLVCNIMFLSQIKKFLKWADAQ